MLNKLDLKQKGFAIKFFKITPKNKSSNFNSVNELIDYIKNQKEKIDKLGLDVDQVQHQDKLGLDVTMCK